MRRMGSARSQKSADASGSKTKLAADLSKAKTSEVPAYITGFTVLSMQKNKDFSWPGALRPQSIEEQN